LAYLARFHIVSPTLCFEHSTTNEESEETFGNEVLNQNYEKRYKLRAVNEAFLIGKGNAEIAHKKSTGDVQRAYQRGMILKLI